MSHNTSPASFSPPTTASATSNQQLDNPPNFQPPSQQAPPFGAQTIPTQPHQQSEPPPIDLEEGKSTQTPDPSTNPTEPPAAHNPSDASDQLSNDINHAYPMDAHASDPAKKEERRRRKIESAQRSREKRRAEHAAVERKVVANNDRIRYLEGEVDRLTSELLRPSAPPSGREPGRPAWFGAPF